MLDHYAKKMIRRNWQLYLVITLPVVYIVIFHYVPMYGILIAFKDFSPTKGILRSPWIGLQSFTRFVTVPSFGRMVRNTITISLYTLIAGFPMPILLALSLNEIRSRWFKKTVQMATYAPYFISTVVMVALLFQILDYRRGPINLLIKALGSEPVLFMGKPQLFKSIYVWSGVWQYTGFGAVIYLAALSSIDPQLYDAAYIDGASRLQRIWHIDLPGILSTIVILFLLNVANVMNVGFEKVYLMQNAQNISASEVIATYIYQIGLRNMDYSFSTAVGLFNSVINLTLLTVANSIAKRITGSSLW
jgi:ABC-type polysaccharide transport system permease subunit